MNPDLLTLRLTPRCSFLAAVLVIVAGAIAPAMAQTQPVYNSIPKPLPPNVASEGPEAYAFAELGDGFTLALPGAGGTIGQVTVVLSSWACQTGNWFAPGTCVTASGATFPQPITVNLYAVNDAGTAHDVQLGTTTQTFTLPYRPSSDSSKCDGTAWFNKKDGNCYHGVAVPISVNFSGFHIPVPTNSKLIVTVAYNTTHYGPVPVGESASCYGTSAGCPYDSLNISTDGNGNLPGSVLVFCQTNSLR